jgi:hypothetical protein
VRGVRKQVPFVGHMDRQVFARDTRRLRLQGEGSAGMKTCGGPKSHLTSQGMLRRHDEGEFGPCFRYGSEPDFGPRKPNVRPTLRSRHHLRRPHPFWACPTSHAIWRGLVDRAVLRQNQPRVLAPRVKVNRWPQPRGIVKCAGSNVSRVASRLRPYLNSATQAYPTVRTNPPCLDPAPIGDTARHWLQFLPLYSERLTWNGDTN